jgi:hypothetical protein
MPSRVGSALDQLAAAVVALAVFALPISLIVLAKSSDSPAFLVAFAVGWPLAGIAVYRVVRTRRRLGSWAETLGILTGASLATWLVAVFAVLAGYSIQINSSLCGGGAAAAIGWIGGLGVYAAGSAWALTRSRSLTAVWGMPVAVLLGVTSALVALAVIPGGHGYCET